MGVTIKDVAEAAGVSISTVSKVLNGHYSISEKTAQRVRGIMREMNYYPNANAQSFASGSNHTVVLLANLAPNAAFQNPHMFEIISGLEEALCKRGYRLILRGADATSACGIAEEIISRRSADAIAVHVGVMSHPLAAVLTRLQFPHIVLGAPDFESQVCWIDNSNTYSGTVAASFLLSRGYKRLAFIGGKSYDLGSALRLQAGAFQRGRETGRPVYLARGIYPGGRLPYGRKSFESERTAGRHHLRQQLHRSGVRGCGREKGTAYSEGYRHYGL